jgi:hypothetical protein
MSKLIEPKPVKLLFSIIYKQSSFDNIKLKLIESFGEMDFESEEMKFDKTDYYRAEMGDYLRRRFMAKKMLIKRDQLIDIKVLTNHLESETSKNDKREFNIDPGYLSHEHFVLATGKGYAHRPYLGKGVYADLTMIYRNNDFVNLEWTYPDYKGEEIKNIMTIIRNRYIENLKGVIADD